MQVQRTVQEGSLSKQTVECAHMANDLAMRLNNMVERFSRPHLAGARSQVERANADFLASLNRIQSEIEALEEVIYGALFMDEP